MAHNLVGLFRRRGILIALCGLISVVLVLSIFRIFYLESWLKTKAEEKVNVASQGLYALKLGDLEISLLAGKLTLRQFNLSSNLTAWKKKQPSSNLPAASLFDLKSPRITVSGINFWQIVMHQNIDLDHLVLEQPHLVFTQIKPDTSKTPLYQKIKKNLQGFRIRHITVKQGQVIYKKFRQSMVVGKLEKLDGTLTDLRLDSLGYAAPNRFFYTQQATLKTGAASILLESGFYQLKTDSLHLSTTQGRLSFKNVKLVPLLSAAGMSRKTGNATPQLQGTAPALSFTGIHFPAYSRSGEINIGEATLQNPVLKIDMDTQHFPQKIRKPLLHELAQKAPFAFKIKAFAIRNMYISYEELARQATEKGYLHLKKLNIAGSNFTNIKGHMSQKNPAVIKGSAFLMSRAFLRATIRLNLLSRAGYHTIEGEVGEMDPRIFNPIVEPSQLVSVKSGLVQRGTFQMTLNGQKARGTMRLVYENFKVDLLSQEEKTEKNEIAEPGKKEKKQSFGKKILSAIANKLVLNSNNKASDQEIKADDKPKIALTNKFIVGKIDTNRRPNRSVFTFWIDGLTSGVRSTLGLASQVPTN